MENLDLLIDLHKRQQRQGPGDDQSAQLALALARHQAQWPAGSPLKIADIGCGTGASTLFLAKALNCTITAVDFLPAFLAELSDRASAEGIHDKITPLESSMEALPFSENDYDMIWSEGAIYNMGFEAGVNAWRSFLKPGGVLAVSEITWTTERRPAPLEQYWAAAYPEIATAPEKIKVLERAGFSPLGYFILPPRSWLESYYAPLEASFPAFLERHTHSEAATALVKAEEEEILLYKTYQAFYSYGFYLVRKVV